METFERNGPQLIILHIGLNACANEQDENMTNKESGNNAAANNRSNQMNSNNAAYHRSRGASESTARNNAAQAGRKK